MRVAGTALGHGLLFPLFDPDAKFATSMVSRQPSWPDEWKELVRQGALWRTRKPGEEHDA